MKALRLGSQETRQEDISWRRPGIQCRMLSVARGMEFSTKEWLVTLVKAVGRV